MQGPDLVRSVAQEKGNLAITGDWSKATDLEVFASGSIDQVTFNAAKVNVHRTSYGSLVGQLSACQHSIDSIAAQLPSLINWKVQDGLPERNANYDDSRWIGRIIFLTLSNRLLTSTVANHSSTPNPLPPATYPVLYADEYGEFVPIFLLMPLLRPRCRIPHREPSLAWKILRKRNRSTPCCYRRNVKWLECVPERCFYRLLGWQYDYHQRLYVAVLRQCNA